MDDIIFGKNAITEALISGEREINKILISKNIHSDAKINKIKELAKERGIVFQFVAKEKFQQYAEFNHQGIIAQISPLKYADLDEFLKKAHNNSSLVILDGIEDSHNTGAIIRSCVCAGVKGVIIPSRRGVLINSTVEKTSAGAANHIKIIKVNSLTGAVQKLKENNYWVIASDHHAKDNYYDINDFKNGINILLYFFEKIFIENEKKEKIKYIKMYFSDIEKLSKDYNI